MDPETDIKHVLLTPSWYPDQRLPHVGTFFREQAQMLKDAGYKVGVVALDSPLSPLRWDLRLKIAEEDGITVIRSKIPQVMWRGLPGDATISKFVSQRALKKYEEINGRPDIVHAHSVFPGIYTAATASRLWGVPYVLTEHRPSSLDRPRNSARGKSITKAVQAANGLAVVSKPFADLLAKHYGTGQWNVIALPVLDNQSDQPLPQLKDGETYSFCHVSHCDDNKRVDMTMRAFAKTHQVIPNTSLTIVGCFGKVMEALNGLRGELGIDDSVTLIPRQPREKIAGILSKAHCFVLASAVEAGGTVFAEAQMAGLPCIGTKTFAGKFMIEPETGIQVPVDDEDALTKSMIDMARDRHNKFRPADIRKRAKERFSEKTFVEDNTDFYNSALRDYTAKK